ncbi:MAG TPA: Gfo/Idh/MocA family oxidoreductase [Tepidisphaeraceae bacterium]|jgi:predicted dehydrogenase
MPIDRFVPSRRSVLKAAGVSAALAALPHWFVEQMLDAAEPKPPTSANDKPDVALIGCGGRGRADAHEASKYCNIVAVCDVHDHHAQGASMEFGEAKPYKDFRKLLERDDIPIVINATPDHWHTLVNLAAMKAGKDVYSEKPLTLTIDEGKHVVDAVERTGRILQTGTQQRSDPNFRLAAELIRNNRLGKLQEVNVWLPAGLKGGPFPAQPVPDGLDWDFWLGQAPKVDYVPERGDFRFRYWYDYSAGTMTDWGAHHNDIVQWALGMDDSGPVEIEGKPTSDLVPGGYTAYSEYQIDYLYANGVPLHVRTTTNDSWGGAYLNKTPGAQHNGIKFVGADGWIWVTRGKIEASKPEILHDALPSDAVRLHVSDDHKADFFQSVRTRQQPVCPAEVGHRSASVCHLGAISTRLGRTLRWDPQKEQFVGDDEANQWLARKQRKPWTYDSV